MFVSEIAKDFVQEYYTRLLTGAGDLHQLYHPQAQLDHGREGKPSVQATFKGPEATASALKWHANTKIMVTDITSIPYRVNQVLVLVLGELLRESATESNSFSHTLILTKRRSGNYQILVDLFRLLDPESPGFNLRPVPIIREAVNSEPQPNKPPTQPSANGGITTELKDDADSGTQRSSSVPRNRNQRRWKDQKEQKHKKKDSVSPAAPLSETLLAAEPKQNGDTKLNNETKSNGDTKPSNETKPSSETKTNGDAKPETKKTNNKPKEFVRNQRGRMNSTEKTEPERGSDASDQKPRNTKGKDLAKPIDLKFSPPPHIPKEPSKDAARELARETAGKETRELGKDKDTQEYPKPDAPKSERNLRSSSKDGLDSQGPSFAKKSASAGPDSAGSDHSGEKRSFKFSKDAFAKASKFQPPKSYSNVTSPQIAVPAMVPPPAAAMQYAPQMYTYGYPMAFPNQGTMMGYPPAMGSNQPSPRYGPVPTQHFPSAPPFSGHQNYPDQYVPSPPMNQHQQHQPPMGQPPYSQ